MMKDSISLSDRHPSPHGDRWHQPFEWVVFDVTGTLLRPDPSPAEVYRTVAASLGHAVEEAPLRQRIRQAMQRHFGNRVIDRADRGEEAGADPSRQASDGPAERPHDLSRPPTDLSRPPTDEAFERQRWQRIVVDSLIELSERDCQRAFDHLWEHFRVASHWRWVEGARELVIRLQRAEVRLAVATNFDARVLAILDGHPPLDRISHRFLSSEIGFSKPDPRFFQSIAARLQSPPERILMIGDDPVNDVAGSEAAGWRALPIEEALGGGPSSSSS